MRRTRVYVDTSVFGGVIDEEFAEASRRFFERVYRGDIVVLLSQVTLDELAGAPDEVRRLFRSLPEGYVFQVPANEEAMALAVAYLDAGILGTSYIADAVHVATATVAEADVILSWNFKHIVNYDRIRKYNGVNALKGYAPIEIRSPPEMANDE